MADLSRKDLFDKLNPVTYKALESAAVFCKMRGNPYLELVHWIHQLVQLNDSDLHRLINHFDLFGLRQVYLYLKGTPYTHLKFNTVGIYKYIRHPLMVGWVLGFWSTPVMTVGHLFFAVMTTIYIITTVPLEEKDLLHFLGEDYENYRQRTPRYIPFLGNKK